MRVGFDLNGVIINNAISKVRVAKRYFGVELPMQNASLATLNGSLRPEAYEHLQDIVYGTSEMLNAPPVSHQGVAYLSQITTKHDSFCVTRIQAAGVQFAQQWLRERWLSADMLISVGPGGDKSRVLQHGFDVYIDDDPKALAQLEGIVPHLILLGRPYNEIWRNHAAFTRIDTWPQLDAYLDSLARAM